MTTAGVCLYSHDDLSLADSLPEDWLTAQGTWNSGNDLSCTLRAVTRWA